MSRPQWCSKRVKWKLQKRLFLTLISAMSTNRTLTEDSLWQISWSCPPCRKSFGFFLPIPLFYGKLIADSSRKKNNTAFYYFLSAQRTSRVNCKNKKYKSLFYFCMRQQMTPICWKNDNAVGQMDSNTILIRTIIAHQGINGTAISKTLLYFVW